MKSVLMVFMATAMSVSSFAGSPEHLAKGLVELDPKKIVFKQFNAGGKVVHGKVVQTWYDGQELHNFETPVDLAATRAVVRLNQLKDRAVRNGQVFLMDTSKPYNHAEFLTIGPVSDMSKPENRLRIELQVTRRERDAYKQKLSECQGKNEQETKVNIEEPKVVEEAHAE